MCVYSLTLDMCFFLEGYPSHFECCTASFHYLHCDYTEHTTATFTYLIPFVPVFSQFRISISDPKQPLPLTVGEVVDSHAAPLIHVEPPAASSPAAERLHQEGITNMKAHTVPCRFHPISQYPNQPIGAISALSRACSLTGFPHCQF